MKILIIFSILGTLLSAGSISGTGWGKSREEAKKEALSDISLKIGSTVSTSYSSSQTIIGYRAEQKKSKNIGLESSYPILRPTFKLFRDGIQWKVVATLSSGESSNSYRNRMKELKVDILKTLKSSRKSRGERKAESLNSILEKLEEFQKLRTVSSEIGVKNIPILSISKSEIEAELIKVEFKKRDDFIKVSGKGLQIEAKLLPKKPTYSVGDEVELFLKFSKKAYYYMVNHSVKSDGSKISYLLQLDYEQTGVNKFVDYMLTPNKWISLGSFEIEEPVGSEFIEIFGKERSFRPKDFPKYSYNSDLDLYVLKSRPKVAIKNGRALRKKRKIAVGKLYFKSQ